MKVWLTWILISAFLFAFSTAHAGPGDYPRAQHRFGLYSSINGDMAPSLVGINLGINATSFLRLNGGIGGYSNWIANAPRALSNYTVGPVTYGFMYFFIMPFIFSMDWLMDGFTQYIMTGKVRTHVSWLKYRPKYHDYQLKYLPVRTIFTYGGGARLFLPFWRLSPTIGAEWAHLKASGGPFGLPDEKSHIYYTAGLDFQGDSGINIAGGYNWCPSLTRAVCGVYFNAGWFF